MNARDERLARNQAIFREVNERVASVAHAQVEAEPIQYEFFCECSDTGCLERIGLSLGDYESLRTQPTWFAIAPGHEYPRIEQIVRKNGQYAIVEKLEDAGEMVAQSDPRG